VKEVRQKYVTAVSHTIIIIVTKHRKYIFLNRLYCFTARNCKSTYQVKKKV